MRYYVKVFTFTENEHNECVVDQAYLTKIKYSNHVDYKYCLDRISAKSFETKEEAEEVLRTYTENGGLDNYWDRIYRPAIKTFLQERNLVGTIEEY